MYFLEHSKFTTFEVTNEKFASKKRPLYYFVECGFLQPDVLFIAGLLIYHIFMVYGYYNMYFNATTSYTVFWATGVGAFSGICISSGPHMLWGHRSYEAKWPARLALMLGHTMSGQFTLYTWAAMHRVHHKWSESCADPHDPRRGSFFAHIGWLVHRRHPEVQIKQQAIDLSDLMKDPIVKFQREYIVPMYLIFGLFIPLTVPIFFWGETFINSFLGYVTQTMTLMHVILLINSAAHLFGDKPYNARIGATDNFWVSALTLGAGYHNYHHSFPQDYQSSESGKGFNVARDVVNVLAYFGLAYNLKCTTPGVVEAAKAKARTLKSQAHGFYGELPEGEYHVKYSHGHSS